MRPGSIADHERARAAGATAMQLLDVCLARAHAPSGQGSVIYTRRFDADARRAAKASDARRTAGRPSSRIDGITVSLKDIFDVAGQPTTVGALAMNDQPPANQDAEIVRRLRAAGAVLTGRTNMTQFALSCLGLNPDWGTPLAPWRREEARIAGGSSSGAAASVADGMALAAIGTDTGGSVRVPAAFCGLVGFKPSQHRVDRRGTFVLSPSLDSIGPIAPTVSCCAVIDGVISNEARPEPTALREIVLGVPASFLVDGLDPEVASTFEATLARLVQNRVRLVDVTIPIAEAFVGIGQLGGLSAVEAARAHGALFEKMRERCDPRVMSRFAAVQNVSEDVYQAILRHRQEIIRWWAGVRHVDALIYPTAAILPPPVAALARDADYFAANALVYRNAGLANLADACAISIPCSREGGPPVGCTLMMANGEDQRLLHLAETLEAAINPIGR